MAQAKGWVSDDGLFESNSLDEVRAYDQRAALAAFAKKHGLSGDEQWTKAILANQDAFREALRNVGFVFVKRAPKGSGSTTTPPAEQADKRSGGAKASTAPQEPEGAEAA